MIGREREKRDRISSRPRAEPDRELGAMIPRSQPELKPRLGHLTVPPEVPLKGFIFK